MVTDWWPEIQKNLTLTDKQFENGLTYVPGYVTYPFDISPLNKQRHGRLANWLLFNVGN